MVERPPDPKIALKSQIEELFSEAAAVKNQSVSEAKRSDNKKPEMSAKYSAKIAIESDVDEKMSLKFKAPPHHGLPNLVEMHPDPKISLRNEIDHLFSANENKYPEISSKTSAKVSSESSGIEAKARFRLSKISDIFHRRSYQEEPFSSKKISINLKTDKKSKEKTEQDGKLRSDRDDPESERQALAKQAENLAGVDGAKIKEKDKSREERKSPSGDEKCSNEDGKNSKDGLASNDSHKKIKFGSSSGHPSSSIVAIKDESIAEEKNEKVSKSTGSVVEKSSKKDNLKRLEEDVRSAIAESSKRKSKDQRESESDSDVSRKEKKRQRKKKKKRKSSKRKNKKKSQRRKASSTSEESDSSDDSDDDSSSGTNSTSEDDSSSDEERRRKKKSSNKKRKKQKSTKKKKKSKKHDFSLRDLTKFAEATGNTDIKKILEEFSAKSYKPPSSAKKAERHSGGTDRNVNKEKPLVDAIDDNCKLKGEVSSHDAKLAEKPGQRDVKLVDKVFEDGVGCTVDSHQNDSSWSGKASRPDDHEFHGAVEAEKSKIKPTLEAAGNAHDKNSLKDISTTKVSSRRRKSSSSKSSDTSGDDSDVDLRRKQLLETVRASQQSLTNKLETIVGKPEAEPDEQDEEKTKEKRKLSSHHHDNTSNIESDEGEDRKSKKKSKRKNRSKSSESDDDSDDRRKRSKRSKSKRRSPDKRRKRSQSSESDKDRKQSKRKIYVQDEAVVLKKSSSKREVRKCGCFVWKFYSSPSPFKNKIKNFYFI